MARPTGVAPLFRKVAGEGTSATSAVPIAVPDTGTTREPRTFEPPSRAVTVRSRVRGPGCVGTKVTATVQSTVRSAFAAAHAGVPIVMSDGAFKAVAVMLAVFTGPWNWRVCV